jgi:hypothetical protein
VARDLASGCKEVHAVLEMWQVRDHEPPGALHRRGELEGDVPGRLLAETPIHCPRNGDQSDERGLDGQDR